MEEFVVRVFKRGRFTVPKRLRELSRVEDGDCVRLALARAALDGLVFCHVFENF